MNLSTVFWNISIGINYLKIKKIKKKERKCFKLFTIEYDASYGPVIDDIYHIEYVPSMPHSKELLS